MNIIRNDLVDAERLDHTIVCRFKKPMLTLSTCRQHGGLRDDITAAINYQICPDGKCPTCRVPIDDLNGHIDRHVKDLGCLPPHTATMLTSAGMEHAGTAERTHENLTVYCITTGGVSTNAARAGDPATHYESPSGWRPVDGHPVGGTINTILLINQPCAPGTLVKAAIMATEAKSATLHRLRVRSMYGTSIATGTGTDQFVISAPQTGEFTLTEAQAHTRLGQMIAEVAAETLQHALGRQNALRTSTRQSVRALLMRFGGDMDAGPRDGDPDAVAAAAALASILNHVAWGIVPAERANAVVVRYAAELAEHVARNGKPASYFETELERVLTACPDTTHAALVEQALLFARK